MPRDKGDSLKKILFMGENHCNNLVIIPQVEALDAIKQSEREKVMCINNQVILKNHKGELEIQNDYGKEALETLNELPEDLSIDLNIKSSRSNKVKKEKKKHKTSRR
ncbi:unnamed protein product, partial [Meganyctiphanes norvegica]